MKSKPDGTHPKIEKYILRKAFDTPEQPYLPDNVLYRQKEAFSDGVGYSWVDGLKAYAESVSTAQKLKLLSVSVGVWHGSNHIYVRMLPYISLFKP